MSVNFQTVEIALNRLVPWEGNVRRTDREAGLAELAASIGAHGLMNALTVREAGRGRFAVVAGQRRLKALQMLVRDKAILKSAAIACHLIEDGQDASELSLAENVVRVAMHPADQFEAWRDLIDKGHGPADIATRFGVAESTVRKRLALGRVSPVILDAYRQGETDLEALQAFTVTDDHASQETVWRGLSDWQRSDARAIRKALTEDAVPMSDARVRFVGLEAYEQAGGAVRRDLFAAEDGGYCEDIPLLDRLAQEKLHGLAADLMKEEGWTWVEARPSFGWDERKAFGQAEPLPLDDALQTERASLCGEFDELSGSDDDEARARMNAIDERLSEIGDMPPVWSDKVKAVSGAVVLLGRDGTAEIIRGLIREGDAPAAEPEQGPCNGTEPAAPGLSASLIEELTAHKTAALRIELARSPDVALAAIVHAVAVSALYPQRAETLKGGLTIRNLEGSIRSCQSCPAVTALDIERSRVCQSLPQNPAGLWSWCLSASRDKLLDVLAVAAAYGVDAVVAKSDPNRSGVAFGAMLSEALALDMGQWYCPTAEGYFGRISKAMILSDLEAARGAPGAPSWEKMKKADLAALAEREVAGTGWLPEPLR